MSIVGLTFLSALRGNGRQVRAGTFVTHMELVASLSSFGGVETVLLTGSTLTLLAAYH
jgi:hypothetical protein